MAGRGDRLVLRSYSPAATIAGAVVLDPLARRKRRGARRRLSRAADAAAAAPWWPRPAAAGMDAPTLAARLTVPLADLGARRRRPGRRASALGRRSAPCHRPRRRSTTWPRTAAAARRVPRREPVAARMPREELRRARLPPRRARRLRARARGLVGARRDPRSAADGVAQAAPRGAPDARGGSRARGAPGRSGARRGLGGIEPAASAGARGPAPAPLADRVARVLIAEGELRRVGEALVHRDRVDELKAEVRRRWPAGHAPGRRARSRS